MSFRRLPVSAALLWFAFTLSAQQQQKPARPPDVAKASYGPHERNVLDLWKAKSDRPTPLVIHIHGGGFTQGDKSGVPGHLLDACLKTRHFRGVDQLPLLDASALSRSDG